MTPRPAILHEDGKYRCPWPGTDPLYVAYHDTDWGVPEFDSRALFEKFILDGFQAGLSWITILRKRETFREAFDGFQPHLIVNYPQPRQNHRHDRERADLDGDRTEAGLHRSVVEAL